MSLPSLRSLGIVGLVLVLLFGVNLLAFYNTFSLSELVSQEHFEVSEALRQVQDEIATLKAARDTTENALRVMGALDTPRPWENDMQTAVDVVYRRVEEVAESLNTLRDDVVALRGHGPSQNDNDGTKKGERGSDTLKTDYEVAWDEEERRRGSQRPRPPAKDAALPLGEAALEAALEMSIVDDQPIDAEAIAVVVMACNRPTYLDRALTSVLGTLNSEDPRNPNASRFTIYVSQDGTDANVKDLLQTTYKDRVRFLQHVDFTPIPPNVSKFHTTYYRISRHYKWAGDVLFHKGFKGLIFLEDDLEVAPDFFNFMMAGARLLEEDPTLLCISAWNDNGRTEHVSDAGALYRTDCFPGLGWMLTRESWDELSPTWPNAFWDDWLREPAQRRGRACIRPEISRTSTFGALGASQGQFFKTHLRHIVLNSEYTDFLKQDLLWLKKDAYEVSWAKRVEEATEVSLSELLKGPSERTSALKVLYNPTPPGPKPQLVRDPLYFHNMAKKLGLMNDVKALVPRTAYHGIVCFRRGGQLIFLVPDPPDMINYETGEVASREV